MQVASDDRTPFSETTLDKIRQLRGVYDLDLTAEHSHRLVEADDR